MTKIKRKDDAIDSDEVALIANVALANLSNNTGCEGFKFLRQNTSKKHKTSPTPRSIDQTNDKTDVGKTVAFPVVPLVCSLL